MSWRPGASIETLRLRAQWLKQIRAFFETRGVLEVETPVLSKASIPDPNIESLQTLVNRHTYYLQTSPELYMKRLLAAGSGPVYQVSRVFRDGELGPLHNPEFTLLEWYRPGFNQGELIQEVTDLIRLLMGLEPADSAIRVISYQALFLEHAHVDPMKVDWEIFFSWIKQNQMSCPIHENDGWHAAMDWLLSIVIQPLMQGIIFVKDYPANQASLARLDPENSAIARRFELFVDGVEIANGFEELTDVVEQRRRFETENQTRGQRGQEEIPLDENFFAALEMGMPEASGVALGFDRLFMLHLGSESIRHVMTFPWPDN